MPTSCRNISDRDGYDNDPAWSPDGTRIAFSTTRWGNREICTARIDGSDLDRLTENSVYDEHPTWSPDGMRIAFRSSRSGADGIYIMNRDGSGQVLCAPDGYEPVWNPTNDVIAFYDDYYSGSYGSIWSVRPDGSDLRKLLTARARHLAWSPDGQKLAYSDYSGEDIYTINSDGSSMTALTTAGYNYYPAYAAR